jgi:type II secretory pathway pseudopilin PulG
MKRHGRMAFTLVELLIVILIIGMLIALILPALGGTKATARQLQCTNNLRNIGMAIINYATSKSGMLPGCVQPIVRSDKKYLQWDGIGDNRPEISKSKYDSTGFILNSRIRWAVPILRHLERQDLWDRIIDGVNFPGDDEQNRIQQISLFICPDDGDLATAPDKAGMTYIANSGAWDFRRYHSLFNLFKPVDYLANESTPETPKGYTKENGLFQNLTFTKSNNRIDNIHDGAGTTLMLSENIHKFEVYTWLGVPGRPDMWQGGEQQFGMVWVTSTAPTVGDQLNNQVRFSSEGESPSDLKYIHPIGPWFCRPASNHTNGSFNVVFADAMVHH